jgi:hypothetical protein
MSRVSGTHRVSPSRLSVSRCDAVGDSGAGGSPIASATLQLSRRIGRVAVGEVHATGSPSGSARTLTSSGSDSAPSLGGLINEYERAA